jgi:hypothetical protein
MNFVVFDLEFDSLLPPVKSSQWENHPPHIICAALVTSSLVPSVYVSADTKMYDDVCSQDMLKKFINELYSFHLRNFSIVTWGGCSGDWRVLMQTFPNDPRIEEMMLASIDIPLASSCYTGMMMSLASASMAIGMAGKVAKDSALIPDRWKTGQQEAVIGRVISDVLATYKVYETLLTQQKLVWMTSKGTLRCWRLSRNEPINVESCLHIPVFNSPYVQTITSKTILSWYPVNKILV